MQSTQLYSISQSIHMIYADHGKQCSLCVWRTLHMQLWDYYNSSIVLHLYNTKCSVAYSMFPLNLLISLHNLVTFDLQCWVPGVLHNVHSCSIAYICIPYTYLYCRHWESIVAVTLMRNCIQVHQLVSVSLEMLLNLTFHFMKQSVRAIP